MKKAIFLSLLMIPVVQSPVLAGKILLNNDEWTLSNRGFLNAPVNTVQFVDNLTHWFTDDRPGNFLAHSESFAYDQLALSQTMGALGHGWTVSNDLPFTVELLSQYDAVFLAGNLQGDDEVKDNQLLIDYVNSGGGIYLSGGTVPTSIDPDAYLIDIERWGEFLEEFGLSYGRCNDLIGLQPIDSTHPVFEGVTRLYQANGSEVLHFGDPRSGIVVEPGLFGIFESEEVEIPEPPLVPFWRGVYRRETTAQ